VSTPNRTHMKNKTAPKTSTPIPLKAPTIAAGAVHRSYRFLADNRSVGEALLWMLVSWAEGAWLQPDRPTDAPHYAQVTLAEGTLDIAELRWLFRQFSSADLALATLKAASKFDGAKQDATCQSFEALQPSGVYVERARRGLQIWVQKTMKNVGAVAVAADGMRPFSSSGRGLPFVPPLPDSGDATFPAQTLADQDALYFRSRLPYATKPGAEDRTFRFRVEFEKDIVPLSALINWAVEEGWQSREGGADIQVKVTLREGTLTLGEMRWLFDTIADCHVAVQTLSLANEYTGERSYQEAVEMGATPPKGEALGKAMAGVDELRGYYESWVGFLDEASERMLTLL